MMLSPSRLWKLRQNIIGRMKQVGLRKSDLPVEAKFLATPPIVSSQMDAVEMPMPELTELAIIAAFLGMHLDIESIKLREI